MPSWNDKLKDWVAKSFRLGGASQGGGSDFGSMLMGGGDDAKAKYGDYIESSTGVYACATLRAETLASVPLRIYKGGDHENREMVTTGALFELLQKVNPFWTLPYLIEMTELALDLHGKAFWVLERGPNGKGTPTEIWWADPTKMTVVPHPSEYLKGYKYEVNNDKIDFTPGEVVWFRNPNPNDQYDGLSPIAAARASIDLGNAGLESNKAIFKNGSQVAGVVSPADKDAKMTPAQADTLREMISRRLTGSKNAHRLAVLTQSVKVESMTLSPKDAEFLGQMRWTLGDICRVFKVSPILVQDLEHSTYSNYEQALKALYQLCLIPQARRIEAWLNEQLLPLFPGEADVIAFDFSGVSVLQEAEDSKWLRESGQIAAGALTINEWRKRQGMDPVPWGDVWWDANQAAPVKDDMPSQELAPAEDADQLEDDEPSKGHKRIGRKRGRLGQEATDLPPDDGSLQAAVSRALWAVKAARKASTSKAIELGSKEHIAAVKKFDRRASRHEKQVKKLVERLFEEQQADILERFDAAKAIISKVEGHNDMVASTLMDMATKAASSDEPFDMDGWIKQFKDGLREALEGVVQDAGDATFDELTVDHVFDLHNPEVVAFMEERAQRFAERVNETTWDSLKKSLSEGETNGETIDELAKRVTDVMEDRIRSSSEVIARTEVIGALNGGALQAAKQSGLEGMKKAWLAAIDDRTRETHNAAHTKYQAKPIPLDADFVVGKGKGQAPGQLGEAEEDIQCRCTLTWVFDGDDD